MHELDAMQHTEETRRVSTHVRHLLQTWSASNRMYFHSAADTWRSRIIHGRNEDYTVLLSKVLDGSMFHQEAVWAALYMDEQCSYVTHDDWGWYRPCVNMPHDGSIICGSTGCCMTTIHTWAGIDNVRAAVCYDLFNAFIGLDKHISVRLITPYTSTPVGDREIVIDDTVRMPDGYMLGVSVHQSSATVYRRVLSEIMVIGVLAIFASLTVLFISLYYRIDKIKYVLDGFTAIINGDDDSLKHAVSMVHKSGVVDEIDILATELSRLNTRLQAMRRAEKKAITDQAEKEYMIVRARERDLLLDQITRAVEEDKAEIARELHDEFGQSIVSIRVDASSIVRSCGDNEDIKTRAIRIGRCCERLSRTVHYIMDDLRPPAIDTHGLRESIIALVRGWEQRLEGRTMYTMEMDTRIDTLSLALQSICYRIVQESLTNIAKHAYARNVQVNIAIEQASSATSGYVIIDIKDDGVGIGGRITSKGSGITGMRERVMALGGSFTLDSMPNAGVRVWCKIPIASHAPNRIH